MITAGHRHCLPAFTASHTEGSISQAEVTAHTDFRIACLSAGHASDTAVYREMPHFCIQCTASQMYIAECQPCMASSLPHGRNVIWVAWHSTEIAFDRYGL
jgi:hypothetical protein